MNDFTKEELMYILKIMDHCYLDAYGQELGRKIQSLIDNYCEHPQTYYSNGVKFDCMDCKKQKDSNEKENII